MSNKRNTMLPGSGKLYDKNGNVFDFTQVMNSLSIFFIWND